MALLDPVHGGEGRWNDVNGAGGESDPVIPANAGIHFDPAPSLAGKHNGSRLSPG